MGRMQVSASGPVAAPAHGVWDLLCDTSGYADWVAATDEVTMAVAPVGEDACEVTPRSPASPRWVRSAR